MKQKNNDNFPFWDESLTIEERLDSLLKAMTLEEKLKCLATKVPDIKSLAVKGFSVGGEAAHGVEARNDQNELGAAELSTSFVQPIGMSTTWDEELIEMAGEVVGKEIRVIYHRHPDRGLSRWAPTVDLERDPRWGRTEEGYGEDPMLIGAMAGAYVNGIQGRHPKYLRAAATLKHFYGNNTEEGRAFKSSSIDPRNKMELYLEPFRRVAEIGHAEAVMTAYNKINGIPGMLNPEVKEVLKKKYGIKHTVCDGGAMELVVNMHKYFGIHAQTLAAALKAGVDAMSDRPELVETAAKEAFELKLITEEEIDTALRNMFRTKLRLGIYDTKGSNPYDNVTEKDINSDENQRICRQVSREAIVLLKNENEMLPLSKDIESFAVIGPLADAWYQDWYGGTPSYKITLKQGINKVTGKEVPYADGWDKVIFRYKDKGVAIAEDGTLCISNEPDVFIKNDWGNGNFTFQSVKTGKYINSEINEDDNDEKGIIAARKTETSDWFVMELFHLITQENNTVQITERFGNFIEVDKNNQLIYRKENKNNGAEFYMEVIESGIQKACEVAANKDVVILALGCNSMINAKEEVDRTTINLPLAQEKLLEEIYKVNKNTILVLFSNYPYAINSADKKLPAILWSATGAQDMGIAMAETIFGINSPAGRLNMTWYRSDEQLPDIDDYDIIKRNRTYRYFKGEVLYPFGYGKTYTQFEYSELSVSIVDYVMLSVSFSLKNTGNRKSDEVAQVYGTAPLSRVKKPIKQLLGFKRVKDILPGEKRKITIKIPVSEFQFYDVISQKMMVEEGYYQILVGSSSKDCCQSTKIWIDGQKTGVRNMEKRIAADHYDEYENVYLTEGEFGYTSVTVLNKEMPGILIYRDCKILPNQKYIILHLTSDTDGAIEVLVDGKKAATFKGKTDIYKDIRLAMEIDNNKKELSEVSTIEIRLNHKVNLCYFRLE